MEIKRVSIKNFKGLETFESKLWGKTVISGDNGTGKTTVLDAISWCMHGKNIESKLPSGPSGFSITPLNQDGSKTVGNTEVEIILRVGEMKTDSIKRTLSGSATSVYINGEPVKLKEYDDWISENICEQEVYRMFSNPLYFPSLPWQDQRKEFMRFFPEPSVDGVMAELPGRLSDDAIEKLRAMPAEKVALLAHENLSEYEKERTAISSKIDLLSERLSEYEKIDDLDELIKKRDSLKAQVDNMHSGMDRASEYNLRLSSLELAVASAKEKINSKRMSFARELETALADAQRESRDLRERGKALFDERKKLSDSNVDTICPVCGQDLPEALIESSKSKIRESIGDITAKIEKYYARYIEVKSAIERLESTSVEETLKAEGLYEELEKAEDLLAQHKGKGNPEVRVPTGVLDEYERISKMVSSYDEYKRNVADIEKYEKELKENARRLEMSQRLEKDAGMYIVARANYLLKIVQSNFKTISVRLFKELVNGKVRECFEITKDGVPYPDLNRAGKLSAGLEFIRYFKKQSGLNIPVIIDDYESYPSVNLAELVGDDVQMILTVVKDGQKELVCQEK